MNRTLLLLLLLSALAPSSDAGVYGSDHRQDVFAVADPRVAEVADSAVSMLMPGQCTPDHEKAPSRYALKTRPYGEDKYLNLCDGQRFKGQPAVSHCSAMLVGSDLVLTAAHCVDSQQACEGYRYVFGFKLDKDDRAPSRLPASEVYACKRLVGFGIKKAVGQSNAFGEDWAVIQLDRRVVNHRPQRLARAYEPRRGDPLFLIGNPNGLPLKFADGGVVTHPDRNGFFIAELDAFGGNSGSSVFSARTGEIVGVLSRQAQPGADVPEIPRSHYSGDFEVDPRRGCFRVNVCPRGVCEGEAVSLPGRALTLVPDPDAPKLTTAGADASVGAAQSLSQSLTGDKP